MFSHKNPVKKVWIIGYGDIGRRVADLYQIRGVQTSITVRSKESCQAARKKHHLHTVRLDLDEGDLTALVRLRNDRLQGVTDIFYFVPPPRQGKKDYRLSRFLEVLGAIPQRIVLISTTGVYGDCKGCWVDETQPLAPRVERAWRRVDAERQLQAWAKEHQREYIILRVPGIYAADRLPLARIKKGWPVVNEAESPWTNRIHADDLAMACYLSMNSTEQNEIFNISDGNPSTMTAYFNQVADAVGLPRPPQISLHQAQEQLSRGMLSYIKESRKINNQKMLDRLGISLRYPCLDDGLKALGGDFP